METSEFAEILRGLLSGRSDFAVFADPDDENLFFVRVKDGEFTSEFNVVIEEK